MTKSTIPTTSAIPNQDRLEILKSTFPEAFTEGKIDLEKLKAALGEDLASGKERYNFTWAGKRDAIGILQIPTRATLVPAPEESINFDTTQNIFIEGDNLEVLKLLYKSYFGRVKLIYIDPPYNTGNDFIYPDNYTDPIETYLQISGQKDAEGNLLTSNPETSGRYHSAWLSMMYPRLFLARQLLRDDGLIFISIDDHEISNLKNICNEIFGEENFVGNLIWKRRQMVDSRAKTGLSIDHEYLVIYSKIGQGKLRGQEKDLEKYSNPDDDPRGPWLSADLTGLATIDQRPNLHYSLLDPNTGIDYPCPVNGWRYSKSTMAKLILDNRIIWPSSPSGRPRLKRYLNEMMDTFTGLSSILNTVYNTQGTKELKELFNGEDVMDFPKPVEYIKLLLDQAINPEDDDIILDFFAGSATTAHGVLKINRDNNGNSKFILIQLPEPTNRSDYSTICEIGKERIRRVIRKYQDYSSSDQPGLPLETRDTPEDLGFRVYKLKESNFKPWVGVQEKDPETYAQQMEAFNDALVEGWTVEAVLTELAIKHGLCLTYQVENIAILGGTVYQLTDPEKEQSLFVCLDSHIDLAAFNELKLDKETIFICLDSALDDETAANLALVCRLETI